MRSLSQIVQNQNVGKFPCIVCQAYFLVCAIFFFNTGLAIDCYVCKSDLDSSCTPTASSPDTVISATNCSDPNKLLNDWITNNDVMKYTIGDLSLEKVVNFLGDETSKAADLEEVTTCAYFIASSENVVTAGVDKAVAQTRSFFGDEHADDAVTVQKWVMRDCVTLKLRPETKEATTDRCFPFSGTENLAKLHFCTCTTDKCNLPNDKVQAFIKEEEGVTKSSSQSSRKSFISHTVFKISIVTMMLIKFVF